MTGFGFLGFWLLKFEFAEIVYVDIFPLLRAPQNDFADDTGRDRFVGFPTWAFDVPADAVRDCG